jgi:hypothetical protein
VVPLLKRLLRQPVPALRPVDSLRSLHGDIEVPALKRKLEPRVRILHKVKRNLSTAKKKKIKSA